MRVLRFRSAAAFEAAAGYWMSADERTNNLILSRLHAARFSDDVKSWLVIDGDAIAIRQLERAVAPALLERIDLIEESAGALSLRS